MQVKRDFRIWLLEEVKRKGSNESTKSLTIVYLGQKPSSGISNLFNVCLGLGSLEGNLAFSGAEKYLNRVRDDHVFANVWDMTSKNLSNTITYKKSNHTRVRYIPISDTNTELRIAWLDC